MKSLWPSLPDESNLWIFSNSKPLNSIEEHSIIDHVKQFLNTWSSHGASLHADVEIVYQQILLIGNDKSAQAASGCSIDKLHHFIAELDLKSGTDFMGRSKVVLKEKEDLYVLPLNKVSSFIAHSCDLSKLEVIQTHHHTLGGWRNGKTLPISESWLKKYLPQAAI